jgi:hypothetical protein
MIVMNLVAAKRIIIIPKKTPAKIIPMCCVNAEIAKTLSMLNTKSMISIAIMVDTN